MSDVRLVLLHDAVDGTGIAIPVCRIVEVVAPYPELADAIKAKGGCAGAEVRTFPTKDGGRVVETLVQETPEAVQKAVNCIVAGQPQPPHRYFSPTKPE